MATIVDTYEKDGETINIYESGAHYNVTRKHLVKAPEHSLITPEKSREYKEQLAEKKREAIVRGAGRALEKAQPGEWTTPNKLDVAEALAEAITLKALNPDNPKQVDAARFILQESGMAETQTKPTDDAQQFVGSIGAALSEIVGILRGVHGEQLRPDVIDGTATNVTDTRNE